MNIVCASDDRFVQHCAVTLVSVLKNNPGEVTIYLLTEGLSDFNAFLLTQLVRNNGGVLNILLVDPALLKNCPMPDEPKLAHISIATYYRLLIPLLLPGDVNKAIYLDCDIVVRKSLAELWNTPIDDLALGAVYQIEESTVSAVKRLGFPLSYGYFNAGVLLVNLKYWRDHDVIARVFDYLNLNKDKILLHDQDTLNALLHDKCLKLPVKWNMMIDLFEKRMLKICDIDNGKIVNDYSIEKSQFLSEMNDPTVLHFVSKPKPWDAGCKHPFKNEYYFYLQFTPWFEYLAPKVVPLLFKQPVTFYFIFKEMIKRIIRGNPYITADTLDGR